MIRTFPSRRLLAFASLAALLHLAAPYPAEAQAVQAETTATKPGTATAFALPYTSSTSQESPTFSSPLRPEGGTQWSVSYGLGINQTIANSAEGIHIASGAVRWSYMWSEKGSGVLRGHPSFAIEFVPAMAFVTAGHTTWALGANIMYEHHFAVAGRVLPVWRIGAGALHAGNPIPAGETAFNFTLLMDAGVDFLVTDRQALYVGYRFHHVSNANIGTVNPGINVHTIAFGMSFYR